MSNEEQWLSLLPNINFKARKMGRNRRPLLDGLNVEEMSLA
jgi:hypothetical protein